MIGKGRFGEMDVAAAGVVDPLGTADLLGFDQPRRCTEQRLDRALVVVAELVSVRPEQLDAVVGEFIVAGGEIITPRSARNSRVSIATAGVGIGPNKTTSMPTEVNPATIADSIM